jgi:hypothetical protein
MGVGKSRKRKIERCEAGVGHSRIVWEIIRKNKK